MWTGVDKNNGKKVLERLLPHANVQELFIEGYPGVIFPGWVGSSTTFPKLTSLELRLMPNVEGWSSECLILPSRLQRLELRVSPKLRLPMPLPSSQ
ncbi:hypothetical protein IFM89_005997 [Coptis chinensis]|uniref:R13L1/DRL21-like LRR repeat region domain-containing protein n=1 Tax=Coptis chinensis TaxID=261450 RepID=A0A835LZD8_9MAGN|nr:hypothetical protein IFM89_005997 [Coptis chinensis]